MIYPVNKVKNAGNNKIPWLQSAVQLLVSRNLILDMRSLEIMKKFGYPVRFDATHSVQMPSKDKGVSGGNPNSLTGSLKAAAAIGINGIFIETHPNPQKALSDAVSMLRLNKIEALLKKLIAIHKQANSFK